MVPQLVQFSENVMSQLRRRDLRLHRAAQQNRQYPNFDTVEPQ
jgi:hypothetical protein